MNVVHSRMWKELQNPFAGDTADQHFDTKVKCWTGWASLWVKFPCWGGGEDGFRTDWYITSFF